MADIVLLVNSDWATCNDGNNTGGAPGATDVIYLNGKTLTLAASSTCAAIHAKASDKVTQSLGTILQGSCTTLNANLYAGVETLLTLTAATLTYGGTAYGGTVGNAAIYAKSGTLIYGGSTPTANFTGTAGVGCILENSRACNITTVSGGTLNVAGHGVVCQGSWSFLETVNIQAATAGCGVQVAAGYVTIRSSNIYNSTTTADCHGITTANGPSMFLIISAQQIGKATGYTGAYGVYLNNSAAVVHIATKFIVGGNSGYGIYVNNVSAGSTLLASSSTGGGNTNAYGLYLNSPRMEAHIRLAAGGNGAGAHGVCSVALVTLTIGVARGGTQSTTAGVRTTVGGYYLVIGLHDQTWSGPSLIGPLVAIGSNAKIRTTGPGGDKNYYAAEGLPTAAETRYGLTTGNVKGAVVIPSKTAVLSGVAVDNTTGTYTQTAALSYLTSANTTLSDCINTGATETNLQAAGTIAANNHTAVGTLAAAIPTKEEIAVAVDSQLTAHHGAGLWQRVSDYQAAVLKRLGTLLKLI